MSLVSYGTMTITDTTDIERIYVVYARSDSNEIPPSVDEEETPWSENISEAPGEGDYIWQRTVVEKSITHDKTFGEPVCITGEKGRSLENTVTEYTCVKSDVIITEENHMQYDWSTDAPINNLGSEYIKTTDEVINTNKTYYIKIDDYEIYDIQEDTNPKELNLYELIDNEYVLTEDTNVVQGKTYYIYVDYNVVDNPQLVDIDNYYELIFIQLVYWCRITNSYNNPEEIEYIFYKDERLTNIFIEINNFNERFDSIQEQIETTNEYINNTNEQLTTYKTSNNLEISRINSRIKNMWIEEETTGEKLAGLYAASGINLELNPNDPNTYGYNMLLRHDALDFRYNTIKFTELSTDALTFYYPKKDLSLINEQWIQGESAIKINADGLFLYNRMKSFLKTEDTQIDASKQYYILEDNNYELVNNPNVEDINNYYEAQTVEDADGKNLAKRLAVKMNTEGLQIINGSPNEHENGNITLSTLPFERELILKGNLEQPVLTETPTDLLLAIGSKFGVGADGTLYANGAHITNIQASEVDIVDKYEPYMTINTENNNSEISVGPKTGEEQVQNSKITINNKGMFLFSNATTQEVRQWINNLQIKPKAWATATEFYAQNGVYERMKLRYMTGGQQIGEHTWFARSTGHLSLKIFRESDENI